MHIQHGQLISAKVGREEKIREDGNRILIGFFVSVRHLVLIVVYLNPTGTMSYHICLLYEGSAKLIEPLKIAHSFFTCNISACL